MAHTAQIMETYQSFYMAAAPLMQITSEKDYQQTLETLEQVLETAEDTLDSSMNPLIDMLSDAIDKYESQDDNLTEFCDDAERIPADIALLRTLMKQHNLSGSELPEIGGKAMVSRVLNGNRELSRSAIEKLSARFALRPAMFFGEID